jgi:hypothetical protein
MLRMFFVVHRVAIPVSKYSFTASSLIDRFEVANHKKKDFIILYRRVMIPKKEFAEMMEAGKCESIVLFQIADQFM